MTGSEYHGMLRRLDEARNRIRNISQTDFEVAAEVAILKLADVVEDLVKKAHEHRA